MTGGARRRGRRLGSPICGEVVRRESTTCRSGIGRSTNGATPASGDVPTESERRLHLARRSMPVRFGNPRDCPWPRKSHFWPLDVSCPRWSIHSRSFQLNTVAGQISYRTEKGNISLKSTRKRLNMHAAYLAATEICGPTPKTIEGLISAKCLLPEWSIASIVPGIGEIMGATIIASMTVVVESPTALTQAITADSSTSSQNGPLRCDFRGGPRRIVVRASPPCHC